MLSAILTVTQNFGTEDFVLNFWITEIKKKKSTKAGNN